MTQDAFTVRARWPDETPPGQRDVAALQIHAHGEPLTRITDFIRREDRDYVRGSAVALAFWLADNFWRLRYESLPNNFAPTADWRLRHEMTSAAGGTLWPPLMIHSTGPRILIAPVFARPVDIGAVRYISPSLTTVSGSEFVEGLDQFFKDVVLNCVRSPDGQSLCELVTALDQERADPDLAAWRRIEAKLGYDPDTVPEDLMAALSDLEPQVGDAALDEAVAAAPGRDAGRFLASAIEAARSSEVVIDLEIARSIALDHNEASTTPPWQMGRDAAQQVRQIAGLDDRAIRMQVLSDLLKTTRDNLKKRGTGRALPYSCRLKRSDGRDAIALQTADARDRRFELSCALADEIWIQADFGVMSRAKTDRQKFQRAFAQNLLVPIQGLANRLDFSHLTEAGINEAAVHYHVHPNVIRRLLVLEEFLPDENFGESLEAA